MIWSHLRGQGITRALGGLIAMLAVCAGRAQAIEFVTDHSINSGQFAGEDIIVTNCTVSIDCTPGFTNYRSLLVRGYGVVRAGTGTLLLGVTGDTTIEAGSRLDASYSGYGHHEGPGAGGSNAGTGATHGGTGGGTGNRAYGLVTEPVTLGSGGGCNNNEQFKGGVGGGAAHIRVGGLFDLAGSVTAAGADGWKAGGGAGGSLWIEAGTLAGAGAIAANGGNAGTADSWPAHGGGGGRVAVHANSSIFSGSLQARGGSGSFSNGGPGSCYFRDAGTSTETLTFDNGGLVGPTRHQAPALTTTDLIVTAPTVMVFDCSSSAVQARDLTVRSGATVTCPANDGSGLLIMVTRDLRVEAGGEVTATGAGHPYQQGLGRGHYNTGDGGTHGGTGSGNWEWWAYGSITEPVLPGSGGGSNNGNQFNGGAGGGRLSMDVTGTATVDGAVSADGGAAYKAGGGSGGSVWMHVGSLAGSGAIRADGGAASTEYWPAQGGGGGRVAVYWDSTAFSGSLSARGGRWTSNGVTASGGPGTVFTQNTTTLQQTVTFDNGGMAGTTYHAALSIAGADWFFSSATVVFRCVDEPLATRDLTVRAGGVVTCPGNDGIGLRVNVGRNLTVDLGGSIDVTGCGYVYEQGPGRGHSNTGDGGTHGGMGARNGWWWAYGSITDPTDQGSGGGSNNGGQFKGSAGGGILAITVLGATTVNGAIAADGAGAWKAGGGAGGSVRVATDSLAGSGTIRANGGGASTQDGWSASGGGGGRVSVTWNTSSFGGSIAATGGQGVAGGASIGGPGTVYTKERLTPRETVTFNNGGLPGYTYHPAFSMSGADLIMASGDVYFGCTAGPLEVRDLTVLAGTVTCPGNDGIGLRVNVGRNLTVNLGGAIDVTGCGYVYEQGPGRGHSNTGDGGTYGGMGARNGWWWAYGSLTDPTDQGSGGGSNNGGQFKGSAGGGILAITVLGDTTVNGAIAADGAGAWKAGGGSGGSIRLATGSLAGSGTIRANGGGAGTQDGWSASGGGGGRVSVTWDTSTYSGSFAARGGQGIAGGASIGGPGTVYTKDRLTPREAVAFDNGGLAGYTYHQAFAMPGADLIMASGEVYFGCTAGPLEVRDLTVLAGTVTCPGNDGAGLRLNVNRNLTVAPGGAVTVSGRGYPDRTGPGGGHYNAGDGGTYGGQGGRNWLAPYGSVHYPDSYGSGGGSNNYSQYTGGPGGGLMRMTVKGDLVVNGSVSADGYGAWEGGAGSGGTLRIVCGTISGTGVISAMGGTSSTADFAAGGGGGGRIAIRRSAGGAFNGGLVTVAGGSGARGGAAGGVGTIYWGDTYSEADLLLVSSDATFVWNADGTGLASVTLGNAGMAVVTGTQVGAYTGVPGAPGTVALGSTTVPSLQPNESVRVSVPVMAGVKVTNLHLVADPDNLIAEGSETNNTVILVVGRTDTSVYVPDRSGIITTTVALKGYLKRLTDNAWLSGKALTFKVAGTAVGTATTDAGGQAVLNWVIDAGAASRALRAEFAGDATYNPSGGNATLTAQTVSTKVYVVDRTAKIKSYVVLKAYLYLLNNATVAGKPMTMKLDGTEMGTMDTNPSGYIQFGYTVAEGAGAGVRTIRTEFAGDAGYNASANTGKLTVTKANLYLWPYVRSGKTGTTLPLKAYVRSLPDYVVQPGKSVAFSVNGTAVDTGVVAADGWATVTWAIPAGEATGAHTATAAFAGDDWYLPVSANAAFNVVP